MTNSPAARSRRRGALIGIVVLILLVVATSQALHDSLLSFLEASKVVILRYPVLGPVAFIALSALSAMVAFVTSAVLVPVAVQAWGPERCIGLLWIGWMLGGLASYGLARGLGRPFIRRLGSARALAEYQNRITRQAPFGVVLLFQLALPSELPGYVLGLARYPLARYLAALALVELPYAVGTVLLGDGLVHRRLWWIVGLTALAALTAIGSIRALRRRLPPGSSLAAPAGR